MFDFYIGEFQFKYMEKYFNIYYEFDQQKVDQIIFKHIEEQKPGYVCSMDMTNLTIAARNSIHLQVVNNSIVNNCDSNWAPVIINWIYGTNHKNYCGTDLFIKYVRMNKFKQFFLGANEEILSGLRNELSKIDPAISDMRFEALPFRTVEDFDYAGIAKMINEDAPDIIWVSLGAPKQEQFMSLLQPHLNRGVMFGFGAIFGFFSGTKNAAKPAPNWMIKNKLQWIFRLIDEPSKQFGRVKMILATIPRLVIDEMKRKNKRKI